MAEDITKINFDDIVTDDCLEPDLITVSKHRYGQLYRERDKYLHLGRLVLVVALIIIVIMIVYNALISVGVNQFIENNQLTTTKLNQQILELQKNNSEYLLTISEDDNEIMQLRDRIGFFALAGAMYEEEEKEEEKKEESLIEIKNNNWIKYIPMFSIGQKVPLPENIDTNTFRCMDYRKITDLTSWQYKIQTLSKTDLSSGLRYYEFNGEKYYTVALATAYGIDLGNAYKVTLQNGTTFNIMHGEYKHDIRYPSPTDYGDPDKNYDGEDTISVIEFIYDWVNAPRGLIKDGEANRWLGEGCDIYGNGCNIVSMEYLGKIWTIM